MDSYIELLIDKLVNSGVDEKTADMGFKMAVEDLKNNKMSDNIAKLFNSVKDDELVRKALNGQIELDRTQEELNKQ